MKLGQICYNATMIEQALFLACGLLSLGVILAIIGALSLRQSAGSRRWPIHPAEVLSARIADGEGGRYAQVRYRYTVAEKSYTSARVFYRGKAPLPGLPAEPLEAILRRYPVGKAIEVHVNPTIPDRSALEPGAGLSAYIPLAAGGLFFVLGLLAGMTALF